MPISCSTKSSREINISSPMESQEATSQFSALVDRISDLPNSILHQILAYPPLSTSDIKRLGILSKRWRDLWKSSPFLNLEDSCFVDSVLKEEGDKESFARFVDSVLLHRDRMDVHMFRLSWCIDLYPDGPQHLFEWCQYAVRHNAKVIMLDFPMYNSDVDLPRCLFQCESLVELSVVFNKMFRLQIPKIGLPTFVLLPQLRMLHLKNLDIDDDSMKKISRGCPSLEKLVLEKCWLMSAVVVFYKLMDLTVKKCCIGGDGFAIYCPNVRSFRFVRNFIDVLQVVLWGLSSVVSATVLTEHSDELKPQNIFKGKYCGNTIDFIRVLSNARTIKMISSRVEIISAKELSELPPFPNLKSLTLGGWRMSNKFQIVAHFIKKSPNLEMLTLTDEEHNNRNEEEASQKTKQLWFHCPDTRIACRFQCGEENERLVDLVSKMIVSTYASPDHKVRIIHQGGGRIQYVDKC